MLRSNLLEVTLLLPVRHGVSEGLVFQPRVMRVEIHHRVAKGGAGYTIFRVGEPHGRVTPRVLEVVEMLRTADSAEPTTNLWGERWSKLVANCMENGLSAATGMKGNEVVRSEAHRRFRIRVGGEAVRVGQAAGYALEDVSGPRMEIDQSALNSMPPAEARAFVEGAVRQLIDREVPTSVACLKAILHGEGVQQLASVEAGHEIVLPVVLSRAELEDIFRTLATESAAERSSNPGLPSEWVHPILAVATVAVAVVRGRDLSQLTLGTSS